MVLRRHTGARGPGRVHLRPAGLRKRWVHPVHGPLPDLPISHRYARPASRATDRSGSNGVASRPSSVDPRPGAVRSVCRPVQRTGGDATGGPYSDRAVHIRFHTVGWNQRAPTPSRRRSHFQSSPNQRGDATRNGASGGPFLLVHMTVVIRKRMQRH